MAAPVIAHAASEVGKTKWGQVAIGVAVIGGTVVAAIVTIKILQTLQIIDTREERRARRQAGKLAGMEAFEPQYYTKRPTKVSISPTQAQMFAKNIYSAKGWFNGNEEKLFGAFRSIGSKWNLSYVAAVFQQMYNI